MSDRLRLAARDGNLQEVRRLVEEEGEDPKRCGGGGCHGIYCPTRIMSGGQNMAAIFGPVSEDEWTPRKFGPPGPTVLGQVDPPVQAS